MNGIVILILALLFIMIIQLLIQHNWKGLLLFLFALYLVFGINHHTR